MRKPKAVFIGFRTAVKKKGIKRKAQFNIIDPDNVTGRNGTTTTVEGLRKLGIKTPKIKLKGGRKC